MLKNLCIFRCCNSSEFCLLYSFCWLLLTVWPRESTSVTMTLVTTHSLVQRKCLCDHDVYILVSDGCTGGDMRLCVFRGSEVAAFVF